MSFLVFERYRQNDCSNCNFFDIECCLRRSYQRQVLLSTGVIGALQAERVETNKIGRSTLNLADIITL